MNSIVKSIDLFLLACILILLCLPRQKPEMYTSQKILNSGVSRDQMAGLLVPFFKHKDLIKRIGVALKTNSYETENESNPEAEKQDEIKYTPSAVEKIYSDDRQISEDDFKSDEAKTIYNDFSNTSEYYERRGFTIVRENELIQLKRKYFTALFLYDDLLSEVNMKNENDYYERYRPYSGVATFYPSELQGSLPDIDQIKYLLIPEYSTYAQITFSEFKAKVASIFEIKYTHNNGLDSIPSNAQANDLMNINIEDLNSIPSNAQANNLMNINIEDLNSMSNAQANNLMNINMEGFVGFAQDSFAKFPNIYKA